MRAGLNAVLAALDAAPSPVSFFVRDDDGGWDDPRLFALLDCTDRAGVPIDLALIPQASGALLARELNARIDAAPGQVNVHQHGFAHCNHEAVGRKCEFGTSRAVDAQRRDLAAGRERLHTLFDGRLDPIFTPPWNRCSPGTPALLTELGYAALSRSRTAPVQHSLPELAVSVDWCKQVRVTAAQGEDGGDRIAFELAESIGAGGPVGLMLHHAEMDGRELALLGCMLAELRSHRRAQWASMREILSTRKSTAAAGVRHEERQMT
jgi:hypothetical protein